MRLHSYTIEHDFGFAPNPFYGVCTLATCKPRIREHAERGDYIIGTGSAKRGRRGYLAYFMCIEEILTYDQYWHDPRFHCKKPCLHGSIMQAFGDNIYHREGRRWIQENSFHSLPNGTANRVNLKHDTQSEKVLVSTDFAYLGRNGPKIPDRFRDYDGIDLCAKRGHLNNKLLPMAPEVIRWLRSLTGSGYKGDPLEWQVRSGRANGLVAMETWC